MLANNGLLDQLEDRLTSSGVSREPKSCTQEAAGSNPAESTINSIRCRLIFKK